MPVERYERSFATGQHDVDDGGSTIDSSLPGTGIYQQALRGVAAWAERGVTPPRSTRYDEHDSQIPVPDRAGQRRGIQPVVDLTANGTDRVEVAAGQPVSFTATIQVPPGAGEVLAAEWDLAGTGDHTPAPVGEPRPTVRLQTTHTYTTPGTYYPALRATAQRDGDTDTPFARVQNLGRVGLVVR